MLFKCNYSRKKNIEKWKHMSKNIQNKEVSPILYNRLVNTCHLHINQLRRIIGTKCESWNSSSHNTLAFRKVISQ